MRSSLTASNNVFSGWYAAGTSVSRYDLLACIHIFSPPDTAQIELFNTENNKVVAKTDGNVLSGVRLYWSPSATVTLAANDTGKYKCRSKDEISELSFRLEVVGE